MTTPTPTGGHGRPTYAKGDSQSPSTAARYLTFDTQALADAGAKELAEATAQSVRWRGVGCDRDGIDAGGQEDIDGYVTGVSMELPAGQPQIHIWVRSPRNDLHGIASSTTALAQTSVPVTIDGSCANPELARAIAAESAVR